MELSGHCTSSALLSVFIEAVCGQFAELITLLWQKSVWGAVMVSAIVVLIVSTWTTLSVFSASATTTWCCTIPQNLDNSMWKKASQHAKSCSMTTKHAVATIPDTLYGAFCLVLPQWSWYPHTFSHNIKWSDRTVHSAASADLNLNFIYRSSSTHLYQFVLGPSSFL